MPGSDLAGTGGGENASYPDLSTPDRHSIRVNPRCLW